MCVNLLQTTHRNLPMRSVSTWYLLLMICWSAPDATSLALSPASMTVGQQATKEENQLPAPRPNPDADGIYRAGDGVIAPKVILAPNPEIPEKARYKKLKGTCVISLVWMPTGTRKMFGL